MLIDKLLELAKKIEDENLRKKVIDLIKSPNLTHPDFKKYEMTPLEEVRTGFSVGGGQIVERDVLNHTITVTEACIELARILEKNFGIPFNKDVLIAAALIHDLMKAYEWKVEGENLKYTNIPLDHTALITAELYKRNFPEEVIHAVAAHAGEQGTVPPRTFEALLLHYVDSIVAVIEYYYYLFLKSNQISSLILKEDENKESEKSK